MAIGTPFHVRTSALCHSYDWRQWSGYLTVSSYNDFVQPEYAAIRNAAALIDVSPLYKYVIEGRDAEALVNRLITQDATAMAVGRVVYAPWCDPDGSVRQEGTVFRQGEQRFMIAAAEPALDWFSRNAVGYEAALRDASTELAALSLQGPHARAILDDLTDGAVTDLAFLHCRQVAIAGVEVSVSRTGYTGDLGYELWIPRAQALMVWDALIAAGRKWQITPCGLVAMDISRVEAGFILIGVDYTSSEFAHIPDERSTPYEIGLGWTVKLDAGNFIGRRALCQAAAAGAARRLVGLQIDWQPLEEAFMAVDLMPDLPMTVCRESVPVYSYEGLQVGRATSRVWSKLLKKYIALATVEAGEADPGRQVEMEVTVHHRRVRVPARVVRPPFFRPERMRG